MRALLYSLTFIRHLFAYAKKRDTKLLFGTLTLSLLSVAIEWAALAALLPLSSAANNTPQPNTLTELLRIPATNTFALLILFGVLFLIRLVTLLGSSALTFTLYRRTITSLSSDVLHSILSSHSLRDIETKGTGYFSSLAGDEANRSAQILLYSLQLLGYITTSIVSFTLLFFFSPNSALATLVFLVICGGVLLFIFIMSYRLGQRYIEQSRTANSAFIEAVSNVRALRALNAEAHASRRYYTLLSVYQKTLGTIDILHVISTTGPVFILIAVTLIWAVIRHHVTNGGATNYPFVLAIIFLLMRFFPAIGSSLTTALRIVSDCRTAKDVVGAILPSTDNDSSHATISTPIHSLSTNNLSFTYNDSVLLNALNLTFMNGTATAITGVSGSGKSTLASLLAGLYEPSQGEVRIDEQPISSFSKADLHQCITLVTQRPFVFNESLRDNVSLGHPATDQEILYALEQADLLSLLHGLPLGLDSPIDPQGSNISGGQLQRLNIARALVRQPSVLILDETLSGLDSHSKTTVLNHLLAYKVGRILLFVTHDPAVIERMDHVVAIPVPSTR